MSSGKAAYAIINGIARRVYHGDATLTPAFLREQILPDLSQAGRSVFPSWFLRDAPR